MEKLIITIECGNSAFAENAASECARILRAMADQLEFTGRAQWPRDANGNRCGCVDIVESAS